MADESDWFFDVIIGFLRSPRWKTPVMSFLDDQCIAFDGEEENKLEFTSIHNAFKKLVEELLEELMTDLGVTDDQFVKSCETAAQNPVHQKIVDQILAVDNYMAFKKLMVKRNKEMNEQALVMDTVEQKAGGDKAKKDVATKKALKVADDMEQMEEDEMMRRAIEESCKMASEVQEEEEMIRQAIEMSSKEEEARVKRVAQLEVEQVRVAEKISKDENSTHSEQISAQVYQKTLEQEKIEQLQKIAQVQATSKLPPVAFKGGLPAIGGNKGNFEVDAAYLAKAQAELNRLADFDQPQVLQKDSRTMQEILKEKREKTEASIEESKSNVTNVSGVESVEARKARMIAQRDLLRKHKKDAMAKELVEFNEKTTNKGDLFTELKKMDEQAKKPADNAAEMEKRRQILRGVKATINNDGGNMSMTAKGSSILDDLEAFKVE